MNNVWRVKKRHHLAAFLMGSLAFFSSWAGYSQLALGLTPVTLASLALALLWMFSVIVSGQLSRFDAQDYAGLLLLGVTGLSYFWSLAPDRWLLQYYYYLLCIFTFFTAKGFLSSPNAWRLVVWGFIFGACVTMAIARPAEEEWGFATERYSIEGLNSNYVAYILAGTVSLVLIYANRFAASIKVSLLLIGFVMAVAYTISIFGTRGAMLSVGLLVIWAVVSRFTGRRVLIGVFVVVGLLLFLVSAGLMDLLLLPLDFFGQDRQTGDLSGRLLIWPMARHYISEAPLLGIGVGAFADINQMKIGSHNVILTMMLEGGALGLGLFLVVIFGSLWPALSKNASTNSRFAAGAFLVYWTPIALSGHWELAPASWLILALHAVAVRENKRFGF